MKFPIFSRSVLIGLEIQAHVLYLAQVVKRAGVYRLKKFIRHAFDVPIFTDGKITNWSYLQKMLREIVAKYYLYGCHVAICLPAHQTHMKYLSVPAHFSDAEIEHEILSQSARDFPGAQESLWIDFVALPTNRSNQQAMMDVFFVAAKSAYLKQLITSIQGAGLVIKIIDVDALIWRRLMTQAGQPFFPSQIIIFANATTITFYFFDKYELVFHQAWPLAEQNFITALPNRIANTLAASPEMVQQPVFFCGDQSPLSQLSGILHITYVDFFSLIKGAAMKHSLLACALAL